MRDQHEMVRGHKQRQLERAVILMTISSDHAPEWSRGDLAAELGAPEQTDLAEVLLRLEHEHVIELRGERVRASRATLRLSELDLIAV